MSAQSLCHSENCGPPLPGAENGGPQFPQPRRKRLPPEIGSPFGGAVERSETEGATAAKPTDPAEAAVEQEYRRLVESAITEGDYQRAVALYREYNTPALRAYKEFYTLKTFSEYAASQG